MASTVVAAAMSATTLSSTASSALSGTRVMMNSSRKSAVPPPVKVAAVRCKAEDSSSSEAMTRRAMVGAVALATFHVLTTAEHANADEPLKGSEEAKKKYKKICVTMPTASVCHN